MLPKEAKDLYFDSIRHRWNRSKITQSDGKMYNDLGWKNQYCQNDYTIQGHLQIKHNLYQIASGIFHKQEYILKNKKSFL